MKFSHYQLHKNLFLILKLLLINSLISTSTYIFVYGQTSDIPNSSLAVKTQAESGGLRYSDAKLGFSLSIPYDWHVYPASSNRTGGTTIFSTFELTTTHPEDLIPSNQLKMDIGVLATDKSSAISLAEWVKQHQWAQDSSNIKETHTWSNLRSSSVINNVIEFQASTETDATANLFFIESYNVIYFVAVMPANSIYLPTVTQVLSTLELDPTQAKQSALVGARSANIPAIPSQGDAPTNYRLPFAGSEQITTGPGCYSTHQGSSSEAIDYGAFYETIYATQGGSVIFSADGWNDGFGNLIKIRHSDNNVSWYAHLSQRSVNTGDTVNLGQGIGISGGSGNVTGPHLHFEVRNSNNQSIWIRDLPNTRWFTGDINHPCMPTGQNDGVATYSGSSGGEATICQDANSEGAILFEHPNFTGRCSRFTGDDNNLGNDTIGNDAASSIKVNGNFEAIIYDNNDFGGTSSRFTGNDSDLSNDAIGNAHASSIQVRRRDAGGTSNCDGGQGVYLYEQGNYQGRCSKFTGDSPNPRGWFVGNDTASSIRMVGSYEATVYQSDEYNGTSSTFTGDDADFGNDAIGHDQASSIRVRQRSAGTGTSNCDGEGVYLYENPNYAGRCSKFTSNSPNPRSWYVGNDTVSSIRIVGNYETTVYQNDEYNGTSSHFASDDPDLGNDAIGNDNVSSVQVGARQQTSSGPTSCDNNQFLAEYFNNRDLTGSPVLRRCEATLNQNWAGSGPGNGVGNDNFSVRWTGNFWFENDAVYKFTTRTDDGMRLWLDNQSILNNWHDMAATSFNVEKPLGAGMHLVRLDYYENGGDAIAQLAWQRQTQPTTATDGEDGRTLNYDTGLDGAVDPANDRDDYYFDGAADQAITIRMDKRDSNLDSYVELYNPDGTLLGQDDDGGGNQNSRLAITLHQNGRHKIIAHGYQSSTGGYRLSLSRESTADPDDNRWITLGGTLQGALSPSNDRDWYYFAGVANRAISIRMNKSDPDLDSYLELYSPAGTKLAENDDGGNDHNAWLVYTLPTDGTYRILARSYNLASAGRYNLSVASVSNTNLARGKPAWATSVEFSGVEPFKAFDGDLNTRWSSRFQDPQMIYVNLGSAQAVNQVVLRWENAYARQYGIFYWTGSEWRQLFWTNSGDGGVDTITFAGVQAQYIGMYGVGRGTQYGYSLYEFEVYNNLSVLLPLVPPDPDDKPLEAGVEPLAPLAPTEDGKIVALIGDGADGQEDMPLADVSAEAPQVGIQDSIPTAHLFYPAMANPPDAAGDQILFQGAGADNDENGASIAAYRWTSSLDGELGTADTFTLSRSALSLGTHVISFMVQDNEGNWSEPVTTTLVIDQQATINNVYLPMVTNR